MSALEDLDPAARKRALRRSKLHPLQRRRALAVMQGTAGGNLPHSRVLLWEDGTAMLDPEPGATHGYMAARGEDGYWSAVKYEA